MIVLPHTAEPSNEATRVTLVGMWLDIVLGLAKIVGGLLGNSFALVTDGIHSLTDAVSDVFVLVMARIGQAEPDVEHPWGHGKFETVGTIGMGMLFFSTAGILVFDSTKQLLNTEDPVVPAVSTMLIAGVSIAGKEWIYHYTMAVAKKLNSSLLKANAWHSRSDAMSSVAVAIGIGGALLGYPWMDTLAAIFVALIIAKIGWELCLDALKELVDTQIPKPRREQIEAVITQVAGVKGISNLRSRLSGGKVLLEISLRVRPDISVSEGHAIGNNAANALTGKFSDISDVIFHIDAELNSPSSSQSKNLPDPQEVRKLLTELWKNTLSAEEIESVHLVYGAHTIAVSITLEATSCNKVKSVGIGDAIVELKFIESLKIYTKAHERIYSH